MLPPLEIPYLMAFSPQRLATCAGVGAAVCVGIQYAIGNRPGGYRSLPSDWYVPLAVLDNWKHGPLFGGCYWLYAGSLDWEKAAVQALEPGFWKSLREFAILPKRMIAKPIVAIPMGFGCGCGLGLYGVLVTDMLLVTEARRDDREEEK